MDGLGGLDTVTSRRRGGRGGRITADKANAGVRVEAEVGATAVQTVPGYNISGADVMPLGYGGAKVAIANQIELATIVDNVYVDVDETKIGQTKWIVQLFFFPDTDTSRPARRESVTGPYWSGTITKTRHTTMTL